jgi:hypothetical protein
MLDLLTIEPLYPPYPTPEEAWVVSVVQQDRVPLWARSLITASRLSMLSHVRKNEGYEHEDRAKAGNVHSE